jgi:hypothetical protein
MLDIPSSSGLVAITITTSMLLIFSLCRKLNTVSKVEYSLKFYYQTPFYDSDKFVRPPRYHYRFNYITGETGVAPNGGTFTPKLDQLLSSEVIQHTYTQRHADGIVIIQANFFP